MAFGKDETEFTVVKKKKVGEQSWNLGGGLWERSEMVRFVPQSLIKCKWRR